MLAIAHELDCANNATEANQLLLELMGNVNPETKLPNEHGKRARPYTMHAGSMDVLLKSMTKARSRFPEIAPQLEHTILQWSYCGLIEDDHFYDYIELDGTIQKQRVAYDSPVRWVGFQALGLLEDKTNRFTFSSYDYGDTPHSFYEKRYHSLFRERCLPHPADGKLFVDKNTYFPNRVALDGDSVTKRYPYSWTPSCDATGNPYATNDWLALEQLAILSPPVEIPAALMPETQATLANISATKKQQNGAEKQPRKEQRKADAIALQSLAAEKIALQQAKEYQAAQQLLKIKALTEAKSDQGTLEQEKLRQQKLFQQRRAQEKKELLLLQAKQAREQQTMTERLALNNNVPTSVAVDLRSLYPKAEEIPVQMPQTTTGGLSANRVIETTTNDDVSGATKKRKKLGISGSFSLTNKSFQSDGFSLSSGISYKPIKDSFWFLRSGIKFTNGDDPLAYSWGIGYDDWHTKTWAVQLNHWGPLKPGDGLDIKNAVAAITYKFGSEFMTEKKIGSFASFSQNLSGDPTLTWGISWSPRPKWFMRTSFSKKLTGGDFTWAYGFGYANYSANTWSLEYNNWGPNKVLKDNFKENGLLALTYRWSF